MSREPSRSIRRGRRASPAPSGRSAHGVDLWCHFHDALWPGERVSPLLDILSPCERARHDRLCGSPARRSFLATRALVRTVLSEYADVPPSAWRFEHGEHGKPFVAAPSVGTPLYFNLTNTAGLIVCAVSTTCSLLGVDAEGFDRRRSFARLADAYFSRTEREALRALPVARRAERFLRYWTLKESYVKARGLGMALPFDQFSFALDRERIRIAFHGSLDDVAEQWSFAQPAISSGHIVAVCAATAGAPLLLRARSHVPRL